MVLPLIQYLDKFAVLLDSRDNRLVKAIVILQIKAKNYYAFSITFIEGAIRKKWEKYNRTYESRSRSRICKKEVFWIFKRKKEILSNINTRCHRRRKDINN